MSAQGWLHQYLNLSVEKNFCTKILCTTCGTTEFFAGLKSASGIRSSKNELPFTFSPKLLESILVELTNLRPDAREERVFEEAIQTLLFRLDQHLGYDHLHVNLSGTWALSILEDMHEDERERLQRRAEHRRKNDPQVKLAKKAQIQAEHQIRMQQQKLRAEQWHAAKASKQI
jgi:hypothetical protein